MASTDATAIPIKNQAYRVTFPILDADGDLVTGATGLDSEVSKDGGTFADCTNEATEIATSSGIYYLDLTSTEMNADTVAIIVKTSSSGAKTTPIVLYPAESGDIIVNVKQINGTNQTARDIGASVLLSTGTGTGQLDFTSGVVKANVTQYGGSNGTFASGRPEVNTTHIAGSAVSTTTAQIGVNAVQISGDSVAADNLENAYDDTAGAVRWHGIIDQGTAQSATDTTLVLRAAAAFADNELNGCLIYISGGTGAGQVRQITSYVGSTDTATVPTWTTTPSGTITYMILPFSGSLSGSVGSVTGNVGGNVTGSVGSLAAQAKADVNAEVVDVLTVDTIAQPGQETPAATQTFAKMVAYLYKALRNKKTQTSTQYSLFNDAGDTVDQKATFADDGTTATVGKISSGP